MTFSSRRVLVTGVTGSIGKELARQFAKSGYFVVGQYHRREDVAKALEKEIGITCLQFDLTLDVPRNALLDGIDILVNNAGVNVSNVPLIDVSDEHWGTTLAINLFAPFRLSRHVLPGMVERKWGRIINVSSIYGLRGSDWNAPYNVSKHGLSGLTKSVAKDYAGYGVTCNEICPGPVDSEMMARIAAEEAPGQKMTPDEYLKNYARKIPALRLAAPGDVALAALYLASDGAGYVNGTSLVVDGAWIS